MLDILSLRQAELESEILSLGEKKFRAKQIYEWLHSKRVTSFDEMTNISVEFRTKLSQHFYLKSLNISRKLESSIDNTVKYLYELSDGNHIETVMMEYHYGNSLCISTQVGCKMGCKFCASTIAGFKRNLSPSEMLLQLYCAERDSGKKVSSIVLMGIGEPLDNYDNVLAFLDILSSENGTNMSLRHVSLSTCGLVDKIYELAKFKYGLTLSISLHAANDLGRSEIMPINNTYNIQKLITACKFYIKETGRRISFEYALIDGVNNSKETADELIRLLRGINCHVNIIPVNSIKERDFKSSRRSVEKFVSFLEDGGINATVRRTLGTDINAACGQLRREYEM
ncbi:MAG: 23S rRNA (adenine(2503)-C(2))-methyltransferase RlmN [Oscillospiraceae bacterium]